MYVLRRLHADGFLMYRNACVRIQDYEGVGTCFHSKSTIRCSEVASKSIVGLELSHSSNMDCRVLHPAFTCMYGHLFTEADIKSS